MSGQGVPEFSVEMKNAGLLEEKFDSELVKPACFVDSLNFTSSQ